MKRLAILVLLFVQFSVFAGAALKTAYSLGGEMDPCDSRSDDLKFSAVSIAASQNDYAGFASTSYKCFRVTASAAINITGILAAAADRVIFIDNTSGSATVTFKHQSGSSGADNRITCTTGADIALAAGEKMAFFYDQAIAEWTNVVVLPSDARNAFKIPVETDGTVLILGGRQWLMRHLSNGPAGASTGTVGLAYGIVIPTIDYNGNSAATRRSTLVTNGLTCKVKVNANTAASAVYLIAATADVTVQFEPEW